jgi:hypothetical protein
MGTTILLCFILSVFWSILIVDYFDPYRLLLKWLGLFYHDTINGPIRNKLSFNKTIDFLLHCLTKLVNCSACISSWLFILSVLILTGTGYGLLFSPIIYFTTLKITRYL